MAMGDSITAGLVARKDPDEPQIHDTEMITRKLIERSQQHLTTSTGTMARIPRALVSRRDG